MASRGEAHRIKWNIRLELDSSEQKSLGGKSCELSCLIMMAAISVFKLGHCPQLVSWHYILVQFGSWTCLLVGS